MITVEQCVTCQRPVRGQGRHCAMCGGQLCDDIDCFEREAAADYCLPCLQEGRENWSRLQVIGRQIGELETEIDVQEEHLDDLREELRNLVKEREELEAKL